MLRKALRYMELVGLEIIVAELATEGLSNKEIAESLGLTESVVKIDLISAQTKLGLRSRAQLIVWCLPHIPYEADNAEMRGY